MFKLRKSYFLLFFMLLKCMSMALGVENIVLIIADDLDVVLDGMTPLSNTAKLIGDSGATFSNYFVASPICCPNRASILTGRYQHNHLTVNNSIAGGCNSERWQTDIEPNTFAAYLKNTAGYSTFYAGKYLNQYGDPKVGGAAHVPTGWDWWAGLIGNSKYYNYSLSINGTKKSYGDKPEEYLTDVIGNLALEYIEGQNGDRPFLMVLAPPAPHAPFTPAKRHIDKYKNVKAKRTPNFNTQTQEDKHWLVRRGPSPLPNNLLPTLDDIFRRRWETLLAVDELVANVYQALKTKNLLENTYIIFTSDNGYHVGQFSMPIDKRQLYETDVKVPLLISGPGISPSEIAVPISTVDLFSTILAIGGIEKESDGTSFLRDTLPADRILLVEYRGERSKGVPPSGCPNDADPDLSFCSEEMACKCEDAANNTYACIRRIAPKLNNIFCVFEDDSNFVESYDMRTDMYQMTNIGYTMKKMRRHKFRKQLKKMVMCKDVDCIYVGSEYVNISTFDIESGSDNIKSFTILLHILIFCLTNFF